MKKGLWGQGVPGEHTATVCAASVTSLRTCGAESPVFAIAVLLTLIVIYDALNVRYQVGLHGAELNRLKREKDISLEDGKKSGKDFKELLGHTPTEVLGGIFLGVIIGLLIPVKI